MSKSAKPPKSNTGNKPGSAAPKGNKGVPNVGSQIYIDTAVAKQNCNSDLDAVKKKCKPEDEKEKKERQKKTPGLLSKLKFPKHPGEAANPDTQWINDHCEFLMIKPSSPDELIGQLESIPGQLAEELGSNVLETVKEKAKEKLEDAIKKKMAKVAAKQAAARVASLAGGPVVALIVNVGMTIWGAKDVADMAQEFPDIQQEIEQATRKIEEAKQAVAKMKDQIDQFKSRYKNKDGSFNAQAAASDLMWGAADLNPCTRAKRCILVPYKETENPQAKKGKGCCPGQTGHHILPSAMFDGCSDYSGKKGHDNAPTICVEGATNSHGSHARIHTQLGKELDKLRIPAGDPIKKSQAIEKGVDSVMNAFPESGCDPNCIEAQLRSFYDKLNCKPKNESGEPGTGKSTATKKK